MFSKSRKLVLPIILLAICTIALLGCTNIKFEDLPEEMTPQSAQIIDISNANNGTIKAHYSSDTKTRLLVKNGENQNSYVLPNDGSEIEVPLNHGDGTYNIEICEHKHDTKFEVVYKKTFNVDHLDVKPFLQPSLMCDFSSSTALVQHADYLCKDLNTDEQKMMAITQWVTENVVYDTGKADALSDSSDYYPSPKDTYNSKSGICYDFSALVAAMLRSQDIPTKIVTGYFDNQETYHSWNQVYINDEWITIDTSMAVTCHHSIVKDSSDYSIKYTF